MLLRKQKSAGADLCFLPSRCPLPRGSLATPGSLRVHRNSWHGASVTGLKNGVRWSTLVPAGAYVSRKREILQRRSVSPLSFRK